MLALLGAIVIGLSLGLFGSGGSILTVPVLMYLLDVPAAMALYKFPTMQEQMSATWLGGGAAKAMTNTAVFLKEQGRIQEVKPNYALFVTDAYVKKAMSK